MAMVDVDVGGEVEVEVEDEDEEREARSDGTRVSWRQRVAEFARRGHTNYIRSTVARCICRY